MPGASTWLQNYRLTFYNVQAQLVTIDIEDHAGGEGVPATYTALKPAEQNPLTIQTVNNSQDPFTPVVAKNAVIRFLSTALLNADTFSSGTDNRYFVEIYTASVILFRGWLLMDDIEERLRNPAFGNTVTLVATDNIGTLKEQELVEDHVTGAALTDGHYSLRQYLQYALARTGLNLNLNLVWNVFEEDMEDTASPLDQASLHSLSFEKEIGSKEDCYTVLQKILTSLKSRLFQYNGEWWVVRLHEHRREADTIRFITYDTLGAIVNAFTDTSTAVTVQGGTGIHFINADANKTNQRPHKLDKDTYNYDYPREIIKNMQFERGDSLPLADPYTTLLQYPTLADFPVRGFFNWFFQALDTGIIYIWADGIYVPGSAAVFELEGWTLEKFGGGTPTVSAYIKRIYKNEDEDSRFLVITGGAGEHWVKAEPVPMHQGDKFTFSVDQKLSANLTGGGYSQNFIAQIRLQGENGTYWMLQGNPNIGKIEWKQTNSSYTTNISYISNNYTPNQIDEMEEWVTTSLEASPLPVPGDITVLLRKSDFAGNDYDTYFTNLQFEYLPLINGSYQKYRGQYNKITQPEGFKAKREDDLSISNSPKRLFKGALQKFNFLTGRWQLTENWTDAFVNGYPDPAPFGRIMAYDTWNQYRRQRMVVNGTIRWVAGNLAFCLLPWRFTLADYSATKRFVCLHYDLNVKQGVARAEFMEVHDTEEENDYTTPNEFNYVQ